jgi:serine/threonine-protein kinase
MYQRPPQPRRSAIHWTSNHLGLGLAIACALVGALPGDARAQTPSGSNAAAAEALFDEARKLLDEGKALEACAKFEASQKLDPGLGTLLYLGECYERAGKTASAWSRFREAASLAAAKGDNRAEVASARAAALEPTLPKLNVTVDATTPGLVVKIDGVEVQQASWGVPLPTDPGQHEVSGEAPGYITWKKTIDVPKEPVRVEVSVPPLVPDPKANEPKKPPSAPQVVEGPGQGLLIGGIIVGGLGVASLAATGVLAGMASSKYGESDDFCEGALCSEQAGVDLANDGRALGDVATITFVAGLALVGVGTTMILLQPSDPEQPTAKVGLVVAPGQLGASFGGTFW